MPSTLKLDPEHEDRVRRIGQHMRKAAPIRIADLPTLRDAPIRPSPVKGGETRGQGKKNS